MVRFFAFCMAMVFLGAALSALYLAYREAKCRKWQRFAGYCMLALVGCAVSFQIFHDLYAEMHPSFRQETRQEKPEVQQEMPDEYCVSENKGYYVVLSHASGPALQPKLYVVGLPQGITPGACFLLYPSPPPVSKEDQFH